MHSIWFLVCPYISNFASFIGSESVHNLFYSLLFSKTVYWSASILLSKTCSLYFLYCVCLLTHRFLRRHIFLYLFCEVAHCKVVRYARYVTFLLYLCWEVAHCKVVQRSCYVTFFLYICWEVAHCKVVQRSCYVTFFLYLFWAVAHCNVFSLFFAWLFQVFVNFPVQYLQLHSYSLHIQYKSTTITLTTIW